MYPFERFTQHAKKALTLAQDEAEKSHQSYIHTEHLLLGLLRLEDGLAAKVLANLGVEIDMVRTTIESMLGRNERIIVQQLIPTSRVKNVIGIAFEEAQRMNNTYVGTEHLLLGLLIEGDGIAAHVLKDLGADVEKVRQGLASYAPAGPMTDVSGHGPAQRPARTHRRPGESPQLPSDAVRTSHASFVYTPLRPTAAAGLNLTAPARSAVALCEEEALRSGTGVIGTDHLLLGLIRQGEGRAAVVLQELGVTLGAARQVSEELRGARDPVLAPGLLESNDYRSALVQAGAQPRPEGGWVDTRHLLQGAVAVPGGAAAKLLQRLGVAPDRVTDALSRLENGSAPE